MQRDLRIGLTLGILLVGVVGAFFFRREPRAKTPDIQLKTAQELDDQIREKPRTPYLTGADLTGAELDDSGKTAARPRKKLTQTPPDFELPDFLHEDDADFQKSQLARRPAAPSPIRFITGERASVPPAKKEANSSKRTHVIKSGETLTGLAARYLGSQLRSEEIFRANRKVLQDPNRLPVGATIRIPAAAPAATQAPAEKIPSSPAVKQKPSAEVKRPAPVADSRPDRNEKTNSAPSRGNSKPALRTSNSRELPLDAGTPAAISFRNDDPAHADLDEEADEKQPSVRFVRSDRIPFSTKAPTQALADDSVDEERLTRPQARTAQRTATSRQVDEDENNPFEVRKPRYYQIRPGDSLAKIAIRTYGTSSKARDIYEANREKLSSPSAIREGMQIVLP